MKIRLIAIGLMLILVSVKAGSVSAATHLDLPFKAVSVVGASECSLHFKNVLIGGKLISVSVNLDYVEIALVKADKLGVVTTIDVFETKSDLDWLIAKRVVISVRSEEDLLLWNKFQQEAHRRREYWRKHLYQPSRVLPPKDLSP